MLVVLTSVTLNVGYTNAVYTNVGYTNVGWTKVGYTKLIKNQEHGLREKQKI